VYAFIIISNIDEKEAGKKEKKESLFVLAAHFKQKRTLIIGTKVSAH